MLKVGLIGCGIMGAAHAEAWMRLSECVQLVSVADKNTERAKQKVAGSGARVYAGADEMLKNEALDVVDICTPTAMHTPFILKAMEYVHDIIVEKPLCLNAEEADLLLAAQKKTGARVQVGHIVRFNPEYEYLANVAHNETYGKLHSAHFKRLRTPPIGMHAFDDENVTGGVALDLHIHDVDFARYLMRGDPDRISSHGTVREDGVIEHIWSIYYYQNARIMTEASWYHPTIQAGFSAKFDKAAILFDGGVLTVHPKDGDAFVPTLRECNKPTEIPTTDWIIRELTRFASAILTDSPAVVSLEDAAGAVRLAKREIAEIKGAAK